MTTSQYRTRLRRIARIEWEDLGLLYCLSKRLWSILRTLGHALANPLPMNERDNSAAYWYAHRPHIREVL